MEQLREIAVRHKLVRKQPRRLTGRQIEILATGAVVFLFTAFFTALYSGAL